MNMSRFFSKGLGLFWVFVLIVLGIVIGLHVYAGVMVVVRLQSLEQEFGRLRETALVMDFDGAGESVSAMRRDLEGIERQLKLAFILGWVPVIGEYHEAGLGVARAGVHMTDALNEGVLIAKNVTSHLNTQGIEGVSVQSVLAFQELPIDQKAQLLQALKNQGDALRAMQTSLHLAKDELQTVEALLPAGLAGLLQEAMNVLNSVTDVVDVFAPLALTLNELAGIDEPKTWLTLFLNNNELRPGGGFIGVVGLANVQRAELNEIVIADSYSIDAPLELLDGYRLQAPQPIQTYTGVEKWYVRDSNWSPDFSQSSEQGIRSFEEATNALVGAGITTIGDVGIENMEVDGVLGFTLSVAEDVLEVTGPVEVDGIVFSASNIRDALQFEVSFGYEGRGLEKEERKIIVAKLTEAVFERILSLPLTKWPTLFELVKSNVESGNIMLYSTDERTQAIFVDQDWAGTMKRGNGEDLMMVVDANMIARKTDPSIARQLTYALQPVEGGYMATVTAEYEHLGEYSLVESTYRNYVRLFVPQGSVLSGGDGFEKNDGMEIITTESEGDVVSFGGFFSLRPGDKKTVQWTYMLPEDVVESIRQGRYILHVEKQLGAFEKSLYLDLLFDAKVKTAIPPESPEQFGDRRYELETVLDADKKFIVEL